MSHNSDINNFDIIVTGATPGGIAAAVVAARMGQRVALVETHAHIGAMSASGLGKSDIENRAMIGGFFKEFTDRIYTYYITKYGENHPNIERSRDGYCFEPSVAEAVFEEIVSECAGITVMKQCRLTAAEIIDNAVKSIELEDCTNGLTLSLRAKIFIDATYEGDLYAAAGAEYRMGRESRQEFDELHAGKVYYDYQTHKFLEGSTGEADDSLPAYTYRLCLTTDPANARRLTEPPPDYNRNEYLGYFDDLKQGRLAGPKNFKPGRGYYPAHFNTMMRALSVAEIPNNKYDANINPRPLGFPFPEENALYVNGSAQERALICKRHRNLALGLLWFLQNDPEIPEAHRREANRFHLPQDEFVDNDNFPFQLYVREARRLVGELTLTENDITRDNDDCAIRSRPDCIAVGEFPIDSFPCHKRQPGDTQVLEGYLGMLDAFTRPYEIPYRIIIPRKIDGLIVPVAASTTHVAYSSIRMEPTWMALGQAAGVAASVAIENGVVPRDIPIEIIQNKLQEQGQVLQHNITIPKKGEVNEANKDM